MVWLAASQACDGTGALPNVRPLGRLDGAAGTLGGVEGRRTADAAPRGRRAAAEEPQAEAELGRSGGTRRPGQAAPQAGADESAGDTRHSAGLASAAGPLAVDLSSQERWIGSCRRELLDRTLIWNQRHLMTVLREYEDFYNEHRPHRTLNQAAPLRPLPGGVIDLDRFRVRRRNS